MSRVLSGMRPTGQLHLGNFFGAIQQFIELQHAGHSCHYFVADLHALTELSEPRDLDSLSIEVAKQYLACGVDGDRCTLYRQSDIPEISEITTLLGNVVRLGALERCTTFKDRVQNKGLRRGEVPLALATYPVLMAADILAVRADFVPVGLDQKQHVEMARDFARSFNTRFRTEALTVPDINLREPIRVPGIDGAEKMGKSDGNTISLLEDAESCKEKVMRIPTQTSPDKEMSAGTAALFHLMRLCSPEAVYADFLSRFRSGQGRFFGEMKERLASDITRLLQPIQNRYERLRDEEVREILTKGARVVRPIATEVLDDMRHAIGLMK